MVGGRPKFGLSETLAAIKKFIFVPGQRRPSTKLDLQSFFSRGTSEGCWELLSTTTFIGNFFLKRQMQKLRMTILRFGEKVSAT